MSTRDQRAFFYDLVGTLQETKVFGFWGEYSCKTYNTLWKYSPTTSCRPKQNWQSVADTSCFDTQTQTTPSQRLLSTIPPTPHNITNILWISSIPIEVDVSTPDATTKRRRIPETPSDTNFNFHYKLSSQNEIKRILAYNSSNTSKYNPSVIKYLRVEIDWDTLVSFIILKKLERPKVPRKDPLCVTGERTVTRLKLGIIKWLQRDLNPQPLSL